MFWLTKGILFASQEIKSMGFSWVCGPRQKDFGLEGCGKRMSDTWSSEICVWYYVSEFQFQKLGKLKKTKGLGRILPSGRRLPYHRLQSLSSELQNVPWYRSVGLGFACCGLWFEFRLLGEFLFRFVELGFRIALEFEGSSSSVQAGSDILLLCGLLLVWISSALGYLWKPDALPSAFWKINKDTKLGKLDFIKRKFITEKADFTKGINPSALWSYSYNAAYIYQS